MKHLLPAIFLVALSVGLLSADEWVSGYYRSNGNYVSGYWRTEKDNNFWNNYSSWGYINPYTGERGYKIPNYNEFTNKPSYYSYTYRPPSYHQRYILAHHRFRW